MFILLGNNPFPANLRSASAHDMIDPVFPLEAAVDVISGIVVAKLSAPPVPSMACPAIAMVRNIAGEWTQLSSPRVPVPTADSRIPAQSGPIIVPTFKQ